jgi:hypothetical protein
LGGVFHGAFGRLISVGAWQVKPCVMQSIKQYNPKWIPRHSLARVSGYPFRAEGTTPFPRLTKRVTAPAALLKIAIVRWFTLMQLSISGGERITIASLLGGSPRESGNNKYCVAVGDSDSRSTRQDAVMNLSYPELWIIMRGR